MNFDLDIVSNYTNLVLYIFMKLDIWSSPVCVIIWKHRKIFSCLVKSFPYQVEIFRRLEVLLRRYDYESKSTKINFICTLCRIILCGVYLFADENPRRRRYHFHSSRKCSGCDCRTGSWRSLGRTCRCPGDDHRRSSRSGIYHLRSKNRNLQTRDWFNRRLYCT